MCPASKAKHSFLRVCVLVLFVRPKELSQTPNPFRLDLSVRRDRCDPEARFHASAELRRAELDCPTFPNCHYIPISSIQRHFKKHICRPGVAGKKGGPAERRALEDDSALSVMDHLATSRGSYDCMIFDTIIEPLRALWVYLEHLILTTLSISQCQSQVNPNTKAFGIYKDLSVRKRKI